MPAYLSHLLQPLDIDYFSPLKRAYSKLIKQKGRLGYNYINKLDFLKAYLTAYKEIFTIENTKSRFRVTRIVPFNPYIVLDKLSLNIVVKTPPPSRGSALIPSSQLYIPHTVRQVHRKASSVKKLLKNRSRSPTSPLK